jgi:hypothetical protein
MWKRYFTRGLYRAQDFIFFPIMEEEHLLIHLGLAKRENKG